MVVPSRSSSKDTLEKGRSQSPGSGTRTLRHSWAIRALPDNSAIKSIADVLGHRYIDTTFIYAKADLNSLREVAMPWPGKTKRYGDLSFSQPARSPAPGFLESTPS